MLFHRMNRVLFTVLMGCWVFCTLPIFAGAPAVADIQNPHQSDLLRFMSDTGSSLSQKADAKSPTNKSKDMGGPDAHGYVYLDSMEPDGPVYSWVDITATGNAVSGLLDDSSAGPFDLGFEMPFYGEYKTQFYISSNGFISLSAASSAFDNQCGLPDLDSPNDIIALMWDDLNPLPTQDVAYYQFFESHPQFGMCMVILFKDWHHYSAEHLSAGTWEVILMPAGDILIQFQDVGVETGAGSTTGIESRLGDMGLTYACNTPDSLMSETAVLFRIEPGIYLNPSEVESSICRGESFQHQFSVINLTGSSTAIELGVEVPEGWIIDLPASIGPIGNWEKQTFVATFTAPSEVGHESITMTATSVNSPIYQDNTTLTVAVDIINIIDGTPMIRPRGDHTVVNGGDGYLYVFGGTDSGFEGIQQVDRFDPMLNVWTTVSQWESPLSVLDAGVIDGIIIIPGGFDGMEADDTTHTYDIRNNIWGTTYPAPSALVGYSVAVGESGLYRLGGSPDTSHQPQNHLAFLEPDTGWTLLASCNHPRMWSHFGRIGDYLYAAGGYNGLNGIVASERYDIVNNVWSDDAMADMPQPIWGGASEIYNGQLMVFGGIDTAGEFSSLIFCYDPETDTWTTLDLQLSEARNRLQAAEANGSVYILGGWNPSFVPHENNDVYRFCEPPEPTPPPAQIVITPSSLIDQVCFQHQYEVVFTVGNETDHDETLDVAYDSIWRVSGPSQIGPVPAHGSVDFSAMITAQTQEETAIRVTVTSTQDPGLTAASYITLRGVTEYWEFESDMNATRQGAPVVSYDNFLYVLGGSQESNTMERYNPGTDTWTSVMLPESFPEYPNSAAEVNGHIYVMSDAVTPPGRLLYDYDIEQNLWTMHPLPDASPRVPDLWAPCLVGLNGFLYVIGGGINPGSGDSVGTFRYDPALDRWEQLADMNQERAFFSAWVYQDMVYVAGGLDSTNTVLSHTEVYDPANNMWISDPLIFPPLPNGLWGMANAIVDDKFIMACGFSIDPVADVWFFDPMNRIWYSAASALSAVYRVRGDAIGDDFYVVGGDVGGYSATNKTQHLLICEPVPTETPIPTDTPVVTSTPTPPPPTSTPTETPTEAPTDTPVPTDTPLPTLTPTPSFTPITPTSTFTPPPTLTPTPTNTSTRTPTMTPPPPTSTPTITPTATPTIPPKGMQLILNGDSFTYRDRFYLHYYMHNPETTAYSADVYILLDVYGTFWCWPSWIQLDDGLDLKRNISVAPQSSYHEIVLDFIWPETDSRASGIYMYGALFEPGTLDIDTLIGEIQVVTFDYY